MTRRIGVLSVFFIGMLTPAAAAFAADDSPMIAFNDHCRQCHSYKKDDNRLGPSLYGVVGRKAGIEPGFDYSSSLKGSNITWTPEMLDKWITNPEALVPGTNMSIFAGLQDPQLRKNIIAFLASDTKS